MNNEYKVIFDKVLGYSHIDPIPSKEDVDKYYREEFYSSNYQNFNDSAIDTQMNEKEFLEMRWEFMLSKSKELLGGLSNISLFDVGCGYGQSLMYFKNKGVYVSGLEPNSDAVEYLAKNDISVIKSSIEDLNLIDSKKYEIVTLLNVLEHLRDPITTLKCIRTHLLSEKGILIIDVPNEYNDFQQIANTEYHLNDWWIAPPAHINYFNLKSLKTVLDKAGYEVVYYESSFPMELFMLFGDVYVGNAELGKKCHDKRVLFEHLMLKYNRSEKLHLLYNALAELDLGRQIIVYAKPIQEI